MADPSPARKAKEEALRIWLRRTLLPKASVEAERMLDSILLPLEARLREAEIGHRMTLAALETANTAMVEEGAKRKIAEARAEKAEAHAIASERLASRAEKLLRKAEAALDETQKTLERVLVVKVGAQRVVELEAELDEARKALRNAVQSLRMGCFTRGEIRAALERALGV